MRLILSTSIEKEALNKLNELHAMNKKGIIKHDRTYKQWKVYETSKPEPDESRLPKWAQQKLNALRTTVRELETYRTMHAVLEDKERDWFTLPDPFNGCTEDELNLWILTKNHPFSICALYKGDLLFIGRAHKSRYGKRLVEPEPIPIGKIKEAVKKAPPRRITAQSLRNKTYKG